jgi:hypothetical protein
MQLAVTKRTIGPKGASMSITAQRAAMLALGGAALLGSTPASAQVDPAIAANILVECSKIGDGSARLACYDNNIRNLDPTALRAAPPRAAAPTASAGAPASQPPQSAQNGFGLENVERRQQRFEPRPASEQELRAVVASSREREPGVYLVTLRDGAEWLFAETVGQSFRPPREGQSVEIERGALGSYLMRVDNQPAVSVRRVR